jgi:hypothetical protein
VEAEKIQEVLVPTEMEDEDDYYDEQEFMIRGLNSLRRVFLDKKPHIKGYYKIRKMHGEIVSTMIQYHYDGKFKQQVNRDFAPKTVHEKSVYLLESDFDLDTKIGFNSYYDMVIYKPASNMNCITEHFIQDHHYRKPEKMDFLQSMLGSKPGLFEITGMDMGEGYVYIKDVFTGDEKK